MEKNLFYFFFVKKLRIVKMNVLSLFDGISCGQQALKSLSIPVSSYYASEIDEHAMAVTRHHFPNTHFCGGVENFDTAPLRKIDLLLGGSPCQSFSKSGRQEGFGGKSGLIYDYIRILKELTEKQGGAPLFLLENVIMKKEWVDKISTLLSEAAKTTITPILLDSKLVSAQTRKRWYWTNIPVNVNELKDRGVTLQSIIQPAITIEKHYYLKQNLIDRVFDQTNSFSKKKFFNPQNDTKIGCCTANYNTNQSCFIQVTGHKPRSLTPLEYERLQTLPDNYTAVNDASDRQRYKMAGNGWTVKIIEFLLKNVQTQKIN